MEVGLSTPRPAAALVLLLVLVGPIPGAAQPRPDTPSQMLGSETAVTDQRWEVSQDGGIGIPRGYVKVGENESHGTKLRLHEDLGIGISGALEGGAAFHFTPRNAFRGTFLYYFMDGATNVPQSIAYNGEMFGPGHVDTNTDFYRVSLDYERELLNRPELVLTGSAGLTYVHLNVTLSGQGKSSPESFFRQELPVPILGLRADFPLTDRVAARAFIAGGGLPPVNSLRQEGGTIYLSQAHADAGVSVTCRITRALEAEAGYRFTYFFQHEKSHEDDNTFQLIDNGFRLALNFRF